MTRIQRAALAEFFADWEGPIRWVGRALGAAVGVMGVMLVLAGAPGCAGGLPAVITNVANVLEDVMGWVDTIERFAASDVYRQLDDESGERLARVFYAVRQAAEGVEAGTHTLAELYDAYSALTAVLAPYGVHTETDRALLGAAKGRLGVPSADMLIPRS